jgi:type IV secretion system protein VirB10
MSKENTPEESEKKDEGAADVEQELSKVASNPKQSLMILVGIVGVFIYIFFNLFISSSDSKKTANVPMPSEIVKPIQVATDSDVPSIPTLPSPPKLEDPTPPPPPLADPSQVAALPSLPAPTPEKEPTLPVPSAATPPAAPAILLPTATANSEEAKKRLEAKRKSSIILVAGTAPAKTPEQIEQETDFKYRGDMNLVLGRGKLIDAIVESAINTDFGGEIRAVVTRDIYSEWGKNILIPKGSRVFGTYSTGMSGAYGRVNVEWNRIDLTSGYSLNLSGAAAVDNLGKKGLQGRVDNKFKERFANAVLKSAFDVALANVLDSITKPPLNSQTAAAQSNTASSLNNIATTINAQPGTDDATLASKFEQICSGVAAAITDKTSTAFTNINTSCNTLRTQTGTTAQQRLTALMAAVNAASTSLLQTTTTDTQPSQAQTASKQAFTDISDTVKTMIEQNEFKPTVTIDQGTAIKIYVNKDYKFPKAALGKAKVMK